jgi:adhesin transport system membrane fusion protein
MSLIQKVKNNKISYKDKKRYNNKDLEFLNSLSAAVVQKAPKRSVMLLVLTFASVVWLVFWASIAQIDVITSADGKVIPSKKVQKVQNLEGGIVSEIMIAEGQIVEKDQPLLKIDDTKFSSSYKESALKSYELEAKAKRLLAEATGKKFKVDKKFSKKYSTLVAQERSLYNSEIQQLEQSVRVLKSRLSQRNSELREAKSKVRNLESNYQLIQRENSLKERLYRKGLISEVEYLELQRKMNEMYSEIESLKNSFPRLRSMINEENNKIKEIRLTFKNKAKKEYNEIMAELGRMNESNVALKDRVSRTLVKAPIKGVVQRLMVNTIGGVVQPGKDLVEIVPLDDKLLIEGKVKPKDIAFIYPGQEAIVKPSAYDFSIYGGLKGKVTLVSADTVTDDEGNSFYLIQARTNKNYLKDKSGKKLQIKVGMTAQVDIITGKKTVLDYILKPINKAKQNAFKER